MLHKEKFKVTTIIDTVSFIGIENRRNYQINLVIVNKIQISNFSNKPNFLNIVIIKHY